MAGSGKAKYLAGLQSLVQGFQAMDERRRQRLLDNLERERFEDDKAYRRDLLREKVAESHRLMGERAQDASAKQRAAFSEQIQRGRVTKNLESGNLKRAERIAFNRGIALPEHTVKTFAPPAAEQDLTPLADERMAKSLGMSLKDYIVWRANVGDSGGGGGSSADEGPSDAGTQAYLGKILGLGALGTPKRDEYEGMRLRGVPVISALGAAEKFKAPTEANERAGAAADIGWVSSVEKAVSQEIHGFAGGDENKGYAIGKAIKQTPQYQELLSLDPEERADALVRLKTTGLSYFGIGE